MQNVITLYTTTYTHTTGVQSYHTVRTITIDVHSPENILNAVRMRDVRN